MPESPDPQQAVDGTTYLTWDFNCSKQQKILMTAFGEKAVLAILDTATSHTKSNRKIVIKGGMSE